MGKGMMDCQVAIPNASNVLGRGHDEELRY